MKLTMGQINKATRNFSPSFKLGQGGFGTVYKGRLEDGKLVAIKRAKKVGRLANVVVCGFSVGFGLLEMVNEGMIFTIVVSPCRLCMINIWVWSSKVRSGLWHVLSI